MASKGDWVTPAIQLVHPLDEGAMGSVWVARHTTLGTDVAVKLISDNVGKNANSVKRFKAEANHSAKIKSPHVVQVFDYGVTETGAPYIVMELMVGESLADRLDREHALSPHDVALIVTQTARGLHAAHKLNITHRDIKPENIFLQDDDGELFIKLLDFGIAKSRMVAGLTQPGAVLGTPSYMSREQVIDSRRVDCRTDLWSLAVVAYQALTGRVPFQGESIGEICAAVWCGEFDPPSATNDLVNEDVDAWFAAALNKEIQNRPQSAKELASSFVRAVATIPEIFDEESMSDWQISGVHMVPEALSAASVASDGTLTPAEAAEIVARSMGGDGEPPSVDAPGRAAATVDSPLVVDEGETMTAVSGPADRDAEAVTVFQSRSGVRNALLGAGAIGALAIGFALADGAPESAPATPAATSMQSGATVAVVPASAKPTASATAVVSSEPAPDGSATQDNAAPPAAPEPSAAPAARAEKPAPKKKKKRPPPARPRRNLGF